MFDLYLWTIVFIPKTMVLSLGLSRRIGIASIRKLIIKRSTWPNHRGKTIHRIDQMVWWSVVGCVISKSDCCQCYNTIIKWFKKCPVYKRSNHQTATTLILVKDVGQGCWWQNIGDRLTFCSTSLLIYSWRGIRATRHHPAFNKHKYGRWN